LLLVSSKGQIGTGADPDAKRSKTMKSHFSLKGPSIAVLMFAGTVAMHQAARAEDVFTGNLAPVAKELLPDDGFAESLAPVVEALLSEKIEEFESKHHGKHGKNGKHANHGKHNGKHGNKGKHHDENEGPSTIELIDPSIIY
jgi:hypothetical protein